MSEIPTAQAAGQATEPGNLTGTWVVLAMTAICMTVVAYNTTAAMTILPDLKVEFNMGPSSLRTVMTIYTLAAATLLPIFGRLADLLRKIYVFILGMAIFAVGALLVVISTDSVVLLIGRMGQGIGAGAMFGTSLGVLSAATPEERRTFVLGLWGAMISLGMTLGPIIAGLFAEYLSWRGVFVLDLILLAIAFVLAIWVVKAGFVPDTRPAEARFDYVGAVSMVLLLGPLCFALNYGGGLGWTSPAILISFAVAAFAGIVFVVYERRISEPLLHVHYFLHPRFLMASLGILISGYLLLCFMFYFNLFVQSPDTLNLSPVMAGAALLPCAGVMFVFSVVAPRLLTPYSFRWPITIGMACMAAACYLLYTTSNTSTYGSMWWKLVILGVGFGLTFPLLPRLGLRLVREEDAGQASGIINTCLYFGATLGTVIGGMASDWATRAQLSNVIAALPPESRSWQEVVAALAHGSPAAIQGALGSLSPAASKALAVALTDLKDDAFDAAILSSAIAATIGVVLALWLLRGAVPAPHSAAALLPDHALKGPEGVAAR